MPLPSRLGIIAGGGALPLDLAKFCDANNIETFICAYEGHADPALYAGRRHHLSSIGKSGGILKAMHENGMKDLVVIGSVRRPKLSELKPDLRTAAFFAKIGMRALGDDGLLKAVRAELESDGFIIHGIQDIMPEIVMPKGVLGAKAPSAEEMTAILDIGLPASRLHGKRDLGQSVVIHGGAVTGTEDEHGTNHLIRNAAKPGAILVKAAKPQQDRKLDMPTIGAETVRLCASLGYAGIAAEAGAVLVAGKGDIVREADASGLFVVGV